MNLLYKRVIFTARLPRLLLELALLSAILLIVFPNAITQSTTDQLTGEAIFITVCCGFWAAMRLRKEARIVRNILAVFAIGISVSGGMFVVIVMRGYMPLLIQDENGPVRLILISMMSIIMFVIFRGIILFWLRWNQMRRQRLIWSFTHILIVILLVFALLGVILFTIDAAMKIGRQGQSPATLSLFLLDVATEVLPVLSAVIVSFAFLVLFLIPPLALISYFLVRGTIRRVQDLVVGTAALRAGNLATRIEVSGEDEVAQLQDDFNEMAADLEEAVSDLEQERDRVAGLLRVQHELAAAVSHELRTPVATIQGYLQPALARIEEMSDLEIHDDLHIVNAEVTRLQKLIDDLFALSRAEVAQLTLTIEPLDVAIAAQGIADVWRPLAWSQGRVDVICQIEAGEHIALGDVGRLEQILTNLVHNALRHTPPGGIVVVAINSDDDWVILDVRDTGEGISEADLPFIWEPFYHGDSNGRDTNNRTGLGLALVKAMTEAMNGHVTVASQSNNGSCFQVRLPKP